MNHFRSSLLAVVAVTASSAHAEVSTPRQVADRPAAHCQAPRFAPDGTQLAYEVYDPKADSRETWILKLSADGRPDGNPMEVTAGRAQAADLLSGKKPPVVEFEWAPNMKLLSRPYVFSSRGANKNFDLFADGDWLTTNPGNDGQPSWSSDGRLIAFASQQKDSGDIYAIDLQGDGKPLRMTFWPTATEFAPRWAPNGRSMLFTRSQSGTKGQDIGLIQDTNKPQETLRMVTEWPGDEVRANFSPDGKWIAFYANKDNKTEKIFDLWVVDTTGQNAKKLAANVVVDDHRGVAWSPDSTTLFYVQQDFKADNPVKWARLDGTAHGVLETGTQLNSDLVVFAKGDRLHLAFKALGQKGSTEKTWERLYVVNFTMADLVPVAP
jgi:Tol biopolymer transport system component